MAKKEITNQFKIYAPGGTATPAPPIGPALGQYGVNPGQFITQFNAATKELRGKVVGVVITTYKDRTFSFEIKSSPGSTILKDLVKAEKGSGEPNKKKIGTVTMAFASATSSVSRPERSGPKRIAVLPPAARISSAICSGVTTGITRARRRTVEANTVEQSAIAS